VLCTRLCPTWFRSRFAGGGDAQLSVSVLSAMSGLSSLSAVTPRWWGRWVLFCWLLAPILIILSLAAFDLVRRGISGGSGYELWHKAGALVVFGSVELLILSTALVLPTLLGTYLLCRFAPLTVETGTRSLAVVLALYGVAVAISHIYLGWMLYQKEWLLFIYIAVICFSWFVWSPRRQAR